MESEKEFLTLKDGYYQNRSFTSNFIKVDGKNFTVHYVVSFDYPDIEAQAHGTFKFGDFGPAPKEVEIASGGIKKYSVDMDFKQHKLKGVITNDRENLYFVGFSNFVDHFHWLNDEDLEKLINDRDSAEAPSCPYKIQPENQGKLVWLSGPPGAGKSTTAQLLGRHDGYVYYEADCTASFLNPFVPTDVENPTIAAFRQKPLKGFSRKFIDEINEVKSQFQKLKQQGKLDEIDFRGFSIIAKDVDVQKKRIGGNFAVAHAVNNQEMRECIRQIVPDVIFITLTLTKESQRKRIQARHGEQAEGPIKILTSIFDMYEPPGENERNTYNVEITDEMTPNDVLEKVQKILADIDLKPK